VFGWVGELQYLPAVTAWKHSSTTGIEYEGSLIALIARQKKLGAFWFFRDFNLVREVAEELEGGSIAGWVVSHHHVVGSGSSRVCNETRVTWSGNIIRQR
jgi:hypothetical protein